MKKYSTHEERMAILEAMKALTNIEKRLINHGHLMTKQNDLVDKAWKLLNEVLYS